MISIQLPPSPLRPRPTAAYPNPSSRHSSLSPSCSARLRSSRPSDCATPESLSQSASWRGTSASRRPTTNQLSGGDALECGACARLTVLLTEWLFDPSLSLCCSWWIQECSYCYARTSTKSMITTRLGSVRPSYGWARCALYAAFPIVYDTLEAHVALLVARRLPFLFSLPLCPQCPSR